MDPANAHVLHGSGSGSRYDVFLSSRGEDTQISFTSRLYLSLSNAGITVFKDDAKSSRGNDISIELLQSIEGSTISIIIFSRNYASSRLCLEELSKIMELHRTKGQLVLPVFYGVDPSEVRHQSSSFGVAFLDLIQRISPTEDKVWRWRIAVCEAANIAGFVVLDSRNQSKDIENIVEYVCKILDKKNLCFIGHPVGVNSRVKNMITLLQNNQSKDVFMVGIWGMAGIGKTSIAKAIYNEIGATFESRSFLSNIKEISKQDDGLVSLQSTLLSDICKAKNMTINSIESGKITLKDRLRHKRALVVLDDVSDLDQLDALFGSQKWFGQGSRIIITSRDLDLLRFFGVDHVYNMEILSHDESLELFSWYAFKQKSPKEEFINISRSMVKDCRGLPLALKVLGSYLCNKETKEWKNTLKRLKTVPNNGILDVLKRSYDGLSYETKEIFLNVVSSFIGEDINDVTQILNGRGFSADIGIRELVEKSLITIDKNNKLLIHDLLQDMGREIMREQSLKELQEQSHRYDVFLSFRGEDTRATFTSHLYLSLSDAGIIVFKDDDELPKGKYISIELFQGIESSKISIIIFSRAYAGSRWCLEELSKIMELHKSQGQVVLPVFYDVDPSEIRHQTSSIGKAFEDLIRNISPSEDEVLKWRTALHEAGSIAGFVVLGTRNEGEDIKKIVQYVCNIVDKKDLFVAKHPVGVNSRVQDVIQMLESSQSKDVLLLGIRGMGGIGKTTIATAIYNKMGHKFESRSFISNIRDTWDQDNGQVCLQNQLLFDICKRTTTIFSIESGKIILKDRLRCKKALIVLDDVDKLEQLDALAGSCEWFCPGSKIIITTRNERLLYDLPVDKVYSMETLGESESLELFSWHAFKYESPRKEYIELSRKIVAYSGGLPLALEVLGSYLFEREVTEWNSVYEKLKKIPNDKIHKKLRISFDGLSDDLEKEIFLDISCFFIGMDRNDVTQILNACGFFADIGINVLVERSLVIIDEKNKLDMHDLLRDMGKEIIREKSPKEPEERSRLWFYEDVLDVLSKQTGTKAVEGLAFKWFQTEKVSFLTKAFKKMKRLRLLLLDNVQLKGDYEYINRDLKWLCWHRFPLKYIPNGFYQENLVAVDLKYSSLRQVWKEPQLLDKLKILNLSHSIYLVQTPEFSRLPNLEKFILKDCPKLSMIHHTIGLLGKLFLLNLKDCTGLRSLPRSIYKLKCLKYLILSGCLMIEKLEEDIEQMDSLTSLIADDTAITQVPFSLVRLKSIGYISLCGFQGSARGVFPSLIRSWMSPTNNPLPLIPTYAGMPTSILWDMLNSGILGSSSIASSLAKQHSPLLECGLEIQTQASRGVAEFMDSLDATNCMNHQTITTNTSHVSDIEPSILANPQSQIHISGIENCLGPLLIQIGMSNQVISALSESISKGLTLRKYGEDIVLPGDKYPYWQAFKGEGASVKFKVPRVSGHDLKGMTVCCEYFPLGDLSNMAFESCVSLMIINYTKTTTLLYKQDTDTSIEEAKWKGIISNMESDDQVEVMVIFGNGFTVKKTAVYLIYDDSFDEETECSSSTARNISRVKHKERRCEEKEEEEEEHQSMRPKKTMKDLQEKS